MATITTKTDLVNWVANNNPANIIILGDRAIDATADALQAADHPAWGTDWEEWLDEHAEQIAMDACEDIEPLRGLTDQERADIRANASGEDVWCGDEAGAEQIARGACDRDGEWSEAAIAEAICIASAAWAASRKVAS